LLAQITSNAEGELTVAGGALPVQDRRRRRRWVLSAAAVVLIATGTAVTLARGGSAPSGLPGGPAVSTSRSAAASSEPSSSAPSAVPETSTGTNRQIADSWIQQNLANLTTPTGAVEVPDNPEPASMPVGPTGIGGGLSQALLTATRFFTAPGNVSDTLSYVQAHPPPGTTASSFGVMSTTKSGRWSDFDPTTVPQAIQGAVISYSIAPHGDGVAIRVDLQAIWTPDRTAEMTIPAPDSVEITVSVSDVVPPGPAPAPVQRTVTGEAARQLADTVNATPTGLSMFESCPAPMNMVTEQVLLRAAGHIWTLQTSTYGCQTQVDFARDGTPLPALRKTAELFDAILAAAGLPSDYAQK
jgi:hypothetical protein